ncbi:MAG: 2-oxo acid dehydrogenase subunit E2 [Flavobacteriaceae bacterium]|nr:2-oxo acid dehydrogenase subunit E2 [Flavobacteriaceae bacterium]
MSKFELKLPKMGESVAEATITSWLKEVGDTIELDEAIVEIATDKVDSEVPCEVEGILIKRFYEVDDVIAVGETIAIIETEDDVVATDDKAGTSNENEVKVIIPSVEVVKAEHTFVKDMVADLKKPSGKFYSPLVKNIAKKEGVTKEELEAINGTGTDQRVTKNDILNYIANRGSVSSDVTSQKLSVHVSKPKSESKIGKTPVSIGGEDEIIEMTRMGKLIAKHMVNSVQVSAHVQSFVEVDVTNIVRWRNRVKDEFFKREGEKITYTPIFMEAVAKALKDFPLMNVSVDGDRIIKRKDINLGMAAALSDGNLIVPVIKKADQLNLVGMTKAVNDLAKRARSGKLMPDDIQGGTFTVTNVGGFGSIMGTPIINQPQVGILALGSVRKMPAVIETPEGDFIGIRHKMIISHSYDHRVVNGALGSMFAKRISDYLEAWDANASF